MSGKYVYLVLCCVMLSAHSYQLNKTVCEESSCLYLYESDNSYVTWDGSRRVCTDEGLEMLSIESSQTQTTVDRLLQDLPRTVQRKIWIGGRQSSDDTWRYMNGTEFNRPVTFTASSDSDLNCVKVKLCKGRNPEYHVDKCDEERSTSRVLCQYDKNQTGECRPSDYEFGEQKCYVKTPYDGSQSNRTDWYSGQTYCSQSRIQGDLAYSYLDDTSSMKSVLSLFYHYDGCALLWLGVRRKIWFWRTVSDSNGQPITYFNWFDNKQIQPSFDNCIYVDRDNGNKWRTQSCYEYLRYFICTKENATSSPTTTTTATNVSELTTAATIPNTSAGNPTTGCKDKQKEFSKISRQKLQNNPFICTKVNRTTKTTTTTSATTFTSDVTATITTLQADNHTTLIQCDNCQLFINYKIAFLTSVLICVMLLGINIGLTVTFIRYRRRMSSQSSSARRTTGWSADDVTHTVATVSRPEGHRVELEVNPYEKPSTYIDMDDRPNPYEALKK